MSRQKIYPHETQEADRGQDGRRRQASFQQFVGIEKKGELLLKKKKLIKPIWFVFNEKKPLNKWFLNWSTGSTKRNGFISLILGIILIKRVDNTFNHRFQVPAYIIAKHTLYRRCVHF